MSASEPVIAGTPTGHTMSFGFLMDHPGLAERLKKYDLVERVKSGVPESERTTGAHVALAGIAVVCGVMETVGTMAVFAASTAEGLAELHCELDKLDAGEQLKPLGPIFEKSRVLDETKLIIYSVGRLAGVAGDRTHELLKLQHRHIQDLEEDLIFEADGALTEMGKRAATACSTFYYFTDDLVKCERADSQIRAERGCIFGSNQLRDERPGLIFVDVTDLHDRLRLAGSHFSWQLNQAQNLAANARYGQRIFDEVREKCQPAKPVLNVVSGLNQAGELGLTVWAGGGGHRAAAHFSLYNGKLGGVVYSQDSTFYQDDFFVSDSIPADRKEKNLELALRVYRISRYKSPLSAEETEQLNMLMPTVLRPSCVATALVDSRPGEKEGKRPPGLWGRFTRKARPKVAVGPPSWHEMFEQVVGTRVHARTRRQSIWGDEAPSEDRLPLPRPPLMAPPAPVPRPRLPAKPSRRDREIAIKEEATDRKLDKWLESRPASVVQVIDVKALRAHWESKET